MPNKDFRACSLPGWAALLLALLPALAGCDREDGASDGDPPDHIIKAPMSQGKYRFGITDTLAVEFDEDIDTAALDLDFTDPGIAWSFQGLRKARFHGTHRDFETPHFQVNTPFTMTMTGLRDLSGNGHPAIAVEFAAYSWIDRDFLDSTFDWYDTLHSGTTWFDGTPVTDTFTVEGALDYAENFGSVDRYDFKVVRLAAPDTLLVSLASRRNLNVRLYAAGPFKPAAFDSLLKDYRFETAPTSGEGTKVIFKDSTGNAGRFTRKFAADLFDHEEVLDDYDAPALYVLRLGVPEGQEGFYRLSVQVRPRK